MRDSVTNDQLLKEVENYVSTKLRTGSVTKVHSTTSDNFYTERFLFEAWKTEVIEPDLNILERLCKKADVVRNLYRLYSIDLAKKASDDTLSAEYMELFACLLMHASISQQDLKFLNTLLKMGSNNLIDFSRTSQLKELLEKAKTAIFQAYEND